MNEVNQEGMRPRGRGRDILWGLLAVAALCGSAAVLTGAVRAVAAGPSFATVLRLAVEAVAAAVVCAAAWRQTGWSRRRATDVASQRRPSRRGP